MFGQIYVFPEIFRFLENFIFIVRLLFYMILSRVFLFVYFTCYLLTSLDMYEFEKKNDKILRFDREKTNTTVFDVWLLPFRLL